MMTTFPPVLHHAVPLEAPYILVVDDDRPNLELMHDLVKLAGHSCRTARSATEALALCDRRRPQVVVTDLAMPNLDGYGLASWLRERYPSVPLILLTGQDLDGSAVATLRRTFTAVLSKPVDVDRLVRLLDRLMPAPNVAGRP